MQSEPMPFDLVAIHAWLRLSSSRAFDAKNMMIDAVVIFAPDLTGQLQSFFAVPETTFVDVQNVVRGCWAVRATRS